MCKHRYWRNFVYSIFLLALNLFHLNTSRPTFKPRYVQFKGTRSTLHQTVFVINVHALLVDDIVQTRTKMYKQRYWPNFVYPVKSV